MPSEFDVTSTSAGEMFLGAFVPGLVLVGLYMVFILVLALIRPKSAPAVHYEGKYDRASPGAWSSLTLVPPLALIFVVLGSIIMGIATVNQAGAIGAVGAMIMAGYRLQDGQRRAILCRRSSRWSSVAAIIVLTADPSDINVKNIATGADAFVDRARPRSRSLAFLIALVWSGWRTLKIDNTLQRRHGGDGQDDVAGVHHPAWRGHADGRVPRLRRRGSRAGVPDRPAGRLLGPVHHRHGGDLPARLLPRLHRDRRRRGADRGADPAGRSRRQRHRGLARRDDRPQHPDLVPDAAVRLRAVLSARRRAGHREDARHVQGRDRLHLPAACGAGHRRPIRRRW